MLLEVGWHTRARALTAFGADLYRIFQRETSKVGDGVGLCGREKEGLARLRQVAKECRERLLETHVKDAISFIENCGI